MEKKQGKQEKQEFPEELKWKYEIAEELGLIERLKQSGWGELNAKETGRIGGLLAVRKRKK